MTADGRPLALLSHLRWVAASLVVIGHLRANLVADYSGDGSLVQTAFYFICGFGHQAVIVFFVLSGFLVGGKVRALAVDDDPDFHRYFIDRFSRIFVVAWPALTFSALVLLFVSVFFPDVPFFVEPGWSSALQYALHEDLSAEQWLASFLLLNELLFDTPAANAPFWSLAYEWTYYMAAMAAVMAYRRWWGVLTIYGGGLAVLVAILQPVMFVGGAVWLLGLLAGWASERGLVRGRVSAGLLLLLVGGVLLWSRAVSVHDLVLGGAIALLLAHDLWRRWAWGGWWGERLAGFSYTLYATHYPMILLMLIPLSTRLPFSWTAVAWVALGFVATVCGAWALAQVTENKTSDFRRWLRSHHGRRQSSPA